MNPCFKYSDYIVNRDFDMREPESRSSWRTGASRCTSLSRAHDQAQEVRHLGVPDVVERKRFVRFPVEVDQFDNLFADFLEDTGTPP